MVFEVMDRMAEPDYRVPFRFVSAAEYALMQSATYAGSDWEEVRRELRLPAPDRAQPPGLRLHGHALEFHFVPAAAGDHWVTVVNTSELGLDPRELAAPGALVPDPSVACRIELREAIAR